MAEDSGARPSAPAALIAGLAVAAGARVLQRGGIAWVLAGAALAGAAPLLAIPAGARCDPPVAEFVPHTFEDAAGPHVHDRCQLESDRRSIAGLALAAGGAASVALLLAHRSPRAPREASGARSGAS
jgi:hypothetical protein